MAGAWATFFCYGSMMVICYQWGQKKYPIPYATKKIVAYIVIAVLVFLLHKGVTSLIPQTIFSLGLGTVLLGAFIWFILKIEKKEFQKLPVVGKFIK